MKITNLELNFLEALAKKVNGSTIFTNQINPDNLNKIQKSGVVSSLVQKNILAIDNESQMIGIIPVNGTSWDAEWELTKKDIQELLERF